MTYDTIFLNGVDGKYRSIRTIGVHKCAHELRGAGFSALVINHVQHFEDHELRQLLSQTVGENTLFVGVSVTWIRHRLSRLLNLLRQCLPPGCKIVVGGAAVGYNLRYPNADYAVVGYAELSVVNLARHLRYGDPLLNARKSLYRHVIIDDPVAQGFDFANSTMVWHDDDLVAPLERVLPLEISRGCVFSCKFCDYRLKGRRDNDYVRAFDILRRELLDTYEKYGVTTYRILDDTFNDSEAKLDLFLDVVQSLPYRPQFWAYIRLDLLCKHPHTIQKLIDIGIISMAFGIETFNKETGRIIGKGYDPEEQIKTIQSIKQTYGNRVYLYGHFIVGLPGESQQSVTRSIDRIATGEVPLDGWSFKFLRIRRANQMSWDSAFGLDLQKYGYEDHGDVVLTPGTPSLVRWSNSHMTMDEAISIDQAAGQHPGAQHSGFVEMDLLNLGIDPFELDSYTVQELDTVFDRYIADYKQCVRDYLALA